MGQWAVIIPANRWADERLFHHDTVTVSAGTSSVRPDDEVLLVADGTVVALARAAKSEAGELALTYLRRAFDDPAPAPEFGSLTEGEPTPVDAETFRRFATALGAEPLGPNRPTWLVSVALPIEATTPAEAVRQFWSHLLDRKSVV